MLAVCDALHRRMKKIRQPSGRRLMLLLAQLVPQAACCSPLLRCKLKIELRRRAPVTHLLLQPTGNPSHYEVIADEQIVGRITLFNALHARRRPWIWTVDVAFQEGRHPVHGFEATREAAME